MYVIIGHLLSVGKFDSDHMLTACVVQKCGLDRDVSVLRRTNVSSRSQTEASWVSSRSRSNMSRSRPSRFRLGSRAIASR